MANGRHAGSEDRRCKVRNCDRKHGVGDFNGTRVYSHYCNSHTCEARAPFVRPQSFCINPKAENAAYCEAHDLMACRTAGCGVLVNNPRDVRPPWFCPTHTCQRPGCFKERVPNHPLCLPHIQQQARAQQQPPPPRVANCSVDGCRMPRSADGPWCQVHTCAVAGCHNETYEDEERRCMEHMPCQEDHCDKYCVVKGHGRDMEPEAYCEKHMKCARRGCTSQREGARPFCQHHSCLINGCHRSNDRGEGKQFCSTHTCESPGCNSVVADAADQKSVLCADHKCADKHCSRRAARPKSFCDGHLCGKASCFERRRTHFCRVHECALEGCSLAAVVANGFCSEGGHACSRQGCGSRRAGDPTRPDLCREHLLRHIEHHARESERARLEAELVARRERERVAAEENAAREAELRAQIEQENRRRIEDATARRAIEEREARQRRQAEEERRQAEEARRREREDLRRQREEVREAMEALKRQRDEVQAEGERLALLRELDEQRRRRDQLERELEAYSSSEEDWNSRGPSPRRGGRGRAPYPPGFRHVRVG